MRNTKSSDLPDSGGIQLDDSPASTEVAVPAIRFRNENLDLLDQSDSRGHHSLVEYLSKQQAGYLQEDYQVDEALLSGSAEVALVPPHTFELLSTRGFYPTAKRMFDFVLSSLALLALMPLMVLIALAIRLTSKGPAFYYHDRVGQGGKLFSCVKFRTMVDDADKLKNDLQDESLHDSQKSFKIRRDPRVTKVGYLLRRSSLDELPQLFNVLVGDMSLVGPRPALPREVELYTAHDWQRLRVPPGLTCIWQISGRSRLPFPEQLELDLQYIEQRSLWKDLKIMALTIPAVLTGDGAY